MTGEEEENRKKGGNLRDGRKREESSQRGTLTTVLHFPVVLGFQLMELCPHPLGDPAISGVLRLSEALEVLCSVRSLVWVPGIIKVKLHILLGGILLVQDRGIEPLSQRAGTTNLWLERT